MTIADVKSGGWASHELLNSAQMNLIRGELLKCIDGAAGGSYSLSGNLTFGGAGEVRFDNVARVRNGGDLFVDSGAAATFASGSAATFAAGSTVLFDSFTVSNNAFFDDDVFFGAGGSTSFDVANVVNFDSLANLKVTSVAQTMRLGLTPVSVNSDISTPNDQKWAFSVALGGWLNTTLDAFSVIGFKLPVMAGDVINSITATVKGGAGSGHGGIDPSFKMALVLSEGPAAGSGGAYSTVTTGTDSATGAGYDATHTFSISPAHTALDRYYLLELFSEFGGSAASGENLLYEIRASITRNRLVSGNNFGS